MSITEKQKFDMEFIKLYEKYFNYLVKYLITIVHDLSSAEDIAHDVFLRMYKNRKIPPSDMVRCKNYMIKSAKNMAIDHMRKQKRDDLKVIRMIPEWDERTDLNNEIENIVIEGYIVSTVNEVLSDFPERNRRIFIEGVLENRCLNNLSSRGKLSRYKVRRIQTEISFRLKEKLKDYI